MINNTELLTQIQTEQGADVTDIYGPCDKALVRWLHTIKYENKPILMCFASPERAFAQIGQQIKERNRLDAPPKVIPLPFGSVDRTDHQYDHTRYVAHGELHRMWVRKDGQKFIGQSAMPQPIKLTYQVNFWARLLKDLDIIMSQIVKQLRANEIYLMTQYAMPEGVLKMHVTLEGIKSLSNLEPEAGQRVLRRGFTFNVDGWIPMPPVEYGIVETVTVDIDDITTSRSLDSGTVTTAEVETPDWAQEVGL